MAFSAAQRVRVTSQHSEHRNMFGTVEVAAADDENGFNRVRLDGHPVGRTVNLADTDLMLTNFERNPIEPDRD